MPKAFGSQISLPRDPTAPLEAATKQYVDAIGGGASLPVGSGAIWFTATPPAGWLICDGSAVPGQYTQLIALIGATLPDLRTRFPVGVGVGGVSPALGTVGGDWSHQHNQTGHVHTVPDIGSSGGHTHVVPNIASSGSHDHGGGTIQTNTTTGGTANRVSVVPSSSSAHTHVVNDATTSGSGHPHTVPDTGTGTTSSQPSNGPTSANNPPWRAVNYIIKAAP